ncbi:MAG: helix-turn-helix domain-containing protein [Vicinamibacterales bacterium]
MTAGAGRWPGPGFDYRSLPCRAGPCRPTRPGGYNRSDGDAHLTGTEGFLTTEEVLAYLQVNLRTVYRLIDAGKLPAVRVGRQWRFRRKDIDAWLDSQRARPGAVAPPPPPVEGGRALVVDPDGPARDLAAGALREAGWTVDTAPDGPLALERLQPGGYDLLLTELRLPGLDAFALVREARRVSPALRVMVVTGHSSETAAIEALNLGVAGYLLKPSRATEIATTAARVLRG